VGPPIKQDVMFAQPSLFPFHFLSQAVVIRNPETDTSKVHERDFNPDLRLNVPVVEEEDGLYLSL
jgi:hypothetical protein